MNVLLFSEPNGFDECRVDKVFKRKKQRQVFFFHYNASKTGSGGFDIEKF